MLSTLAIIIRGMLMGIADSIPGVSGGTVAMIVGIYERLIGAISNFGLDFVKMVLKGQWKAAWNHVDLGFLITLILGIAIGLGSFSVLITHLLAHHLPVTFACFMGMILASVLILYRQISQKTILNILAMVIGTVAAYFITSIPQVQGNDGNLLYIFVCGAIAICAMILPGISGSYILLILGEYHHIIHRVKELAQGRTTVSDFLTLCVFGCGCVLGLLFFSRFLKYLLKHYHSTTLAVLTGFMIGSLRCLWPFQVQDGKEFKMLAMTDFSTATQIHVVIALILGLAIVLLLERIANKLG
ncbi:MAG: DUF368 domain-containing protein [Planctomycetia bacterium]|nr:DUF368 domain-containing protein [Planctomycetia bacterium]